LDTEARLRSYTNWLRQQYQITHRPDSNSDEISTPFLNHLNDNIRLYVSILDNDRIQLDDDGETLTNLELSGINLRAPLPRRVIQETCQNFSITQNEDTLQVISNTTNFPVIMHQLTSVILRIDDISFLKLP